MSLLVISGKLLPAPVGHWYGPCQQDTVGFGLLAYQGWEISTLPGVHSHPAPHCSAPIKVGFAPLFALQAFKAQHLVKSPQPAKQDICTTCRACLNLCCLKGLVFFGSLGLSIVNLPWWEQSVVQWCVCCTFANGHW